MKIPSILTVGLAIALASCNKEVTSQKSPGDGSSKAPGKEQTTKAGNQSVLSPYLLKEAPKEVAGIFDLRKSAKPGEKVSFKGEVIGGDQVFVEGRAIMVMGDPTKLTSCDKIPGDECERPWDVCCDDPDVIKESILTVQIVDDSGSPLKENLKGLNGLKEVSTVSVTGVVAEGSSDTNMLINASGIYVHSQK